MNKYSKYYKQIREHLYIAIPDKMHEACPHVSCIVDKDISRAIFNIMQRGMVDEIVDEVTEIGVLNHEVQVTRQRKV